MRFAGNEIDVGIGTTKLHRNLESIKNQPRTCLKKEQKRGHQPRKSGMILGAISSRLYGFSLYALNAMST